MIAPGSTLGLLGGGQLGAMFAAQAVRLGYKVVVVDPDQHAPAARFAVEHIRTAWTDPDVVSGLARTVAAVTTEFENVPATVLRALAAHCPVRPSASAVERCQDRIAEKLFLREAGVATVRWAPVRDATEMDRAWSTLAATSAILKTAQMGYDGKGQVVVERERDLPGAWQQLRQVPCILEQRVELAAEVSVMVARGQDGAIATWEVAENVHVNGILHTTVVPASIDSGLATSARDVGHRIVSALDYVGVMGVECFVTADGELLVNELAPRPHNSGHWTLDAAVTSQFEQQVRMLAGLPPGDTGLLAPVATINILGDLWRDGAPDFAAALGVPGVTLHLYGKTEPRPGRKMGHLTAVAGSADGALAAATRAWQMLQAGVPG